MFSETNPKNVLGYLKEVHLTANLKKTKLPPPKKMLKKYLQ